MFSFFHTWHFSLTFYQLWWASSNIRNEISSWKIITQMIRRKVRKLVWVHYKIDQQLSVICNLHFKYYEGSRQYQSHFCHVKYMWILFKYFCECSKCEENVMFSTHDLAHCHLQTLILTKDTDYQPCNCWNVLRKDFPLSNEKYTAGLVNWFYNVIFMQIRHSCSWLNHDYRKFKGSGKQGFS